jgi:hypothetical protein
MQFERAYSSAFHDAEEYVGVMRKNIRKIPTEMSVKFGYPARWVYLRFRKSKRDNGLTKEVGRWIPQQKQSAFSIGSSSRNVTTH